MENSEIETAREVLRKYWGYSDFRLGQTHAIRQILSGKDTLTIMPTGGGKSLCYQVPAMLLPGVTIVVSPLISLMKDQVDTLEGLGMPATFVNSTLSPAEMAERLSAAERGDIKLVYVAPERFDSEVFQERVRRIRVSLLAVDEAHCVSQWGHDFRPSYLRIGHVRGMLGGPPVAALTATATDQVRTDIVRQLGLREPDVLVTGFDRRNLTWHVLRAKNDSEKDRLLLRLLRGREGSAIVYASTRKNVDALTALATGVGLRAVGYHAGLGDAERKRVQESFMGGEASVVVATNAFGMGIDKRDVRLVAHYNMPGSLEAYYQEAGRAGRDGADADCVLLHSYADRFTHEFFIEQTYPSRETVETVLRELRRRASAGGVIDVPLVELARQIRGVKSDRQLGSALRLLADHGLVRQLSANAPPMPHVRLTATPERIRRDLDAQERGAELRFLRNLWRLGGGERVYQGAELSWRELARAAGGQPAAQQLLDSLQREGFLAWQDASAGEGTQVLNHHTPLNRLPVDWRAIDARKSGDEKKLQRMQGYAYHERCRRGYLLRYFGDAAAMDECGACDNCLQEVPETTRSRRLDIAPAGDDPPAPARPDRRDSQDPVDRGLQGTALALYERLRRIRAEVATRAGLPAYFVLSDAALRELAEQCPITPEGMLNVHGIGAKTLEKYGLPFLSVLREHSGEGPAAEVSVPAHSTTRTASQAGEPRDPPSEIESALYAELRALRGEIARSESVPAYCVFPDKTLIQLARLRPQSETAFLAVPGVGPAKLEKYSERFLRVLRRDGAE